MISTSVLQLSLSTEDLLEAGLTKNLLQIHDGGIGTDAVNGLRLLEIHPLLEHLAVSGTGIVLVSHCSKFELDKLERSGGGAVDKALPS
jgi:hypothetical protein